MGSTSADATRALPAGMSQVKPTEDWERAVDSWLSNETEDIVHLVGVGNPIRQDDGVGLEVVSLLLRELGSRPSPKVRIHPPCFIPERLLSKVAAKGERLMIFDAVEANRKPGAIVYAPLDETRFGFFATHNVPLKLIPDVASNLRKACVVGIQPESLEVGEGLSTTAKVAIDKVVATVGAIVGGMSNEHL